MQEIPVFRGAKALQYLTEKAVRGTLPPLVTISGGTCAGKTTFGNKLAENIRRCGKSAVTLSLDSYFRDHDDPNHPVVDGKKIFDMPESFCGEEFRDAVTRLVHGSAVEIPIYDLPANKRGTQKQMLVPCDFVIADGIFAARFFSDLASTEVLHVYMDINTEESRTRRIERDCRVHSVAPERIERMFELKILPFWHLHQQCEKTLAHIIVCDTDKRSD